ncbi:MAG: hypothetical protein QXO69_03350 [archaeon]
MLINKTLVIVTGDGLGLEGELQLLETLKQYDVMCVHRLEQRRITEFLAEADQSTKRECEQLFRKNRMLPRDSQTYQVDLMAWKRGHWAALAIEQKDSEGARKILDITKDHVTLKAVCDNGIREFRKSGRQLYLQCKGEEYLVQAYCNAYGINARAVPVGVVDYDLFVNSRVHVPWAYHRGVFFVHERAFEWFAKQYADGAAWIGKIVADEPKVVYNKVYESRLPAFYF